MSIIKNKLSFLITTILLATMLSGCATSWWDAKYGVEKPHISYVQNDSGEMQDRLYVWKPNNNAAYVFQNGDHSLAACLASADVAKSRNVESEFKVDLGNVLDKIDSASVENKLKIIENITKLSEKKESASFLNVAMFHICMMAGAGKITPAESKDLMSKAIENAAKLSIKEGG